MASDDVYVVTGTQLNRRVKDENGEWGSANIPRGTEIKVGDSFADGDSGVTTKEIKRWLDLRPRMLLSKADLDKAQQTAADQASMISDLQAQLEAANRQLSAAVAQGADLSNLEGADDRTVGQPAGNASADDWKAYAKSVAPESEHEAIDGMSRDELRDKYSKAS